MGVLLQFLKGYMVVISIQHGVNCGLITITYGLCDVSAPSVNINNDLISLLNTHLLLAFQIFS